MLQPTYQRLIVYQIDALVAAVGDRPIAWAYDAVSEHGSSLVLARTLAKLTKSGKVTTVLPTPEEEQKQFPAGIAYELTMVGTVHTEDAKCTSSSSSSERIT